MANDRPFDLARFESLVHYICDRADPMQLGSTKLYKILWYSDMLAFMSTGQSITGATYQKREHGPVPSQALETIETLEARGTIRRRYDRAYSYTKTTYLSLEDADPELFSGREISLVDGLIDEICNRHTASSISERSHNDIWSLAEDGEEIPLFALYAAEPVPPTDDQIEWARQHVHEVL